MYKKLHVVISNENYDYVRYTQDLETNLRKLESHLHVSDNPEEIAMGALKAACDFYKADWAGIIVVDFDVNIWAPFWWYTSASNDKTLEMLNEFESSEYLENWVSAMRKNQAITVRDVNEIKYKFPTEYSVYKRLGVKSIMGFPFKPHPVGFLIVRNPKRYIDRSSMLQMLSYVVSNAVIQKKFYDGVKMIVSPQNIKNDKDIIINVFGKLEIYTSKGVLKEDDLKSPKICRILVYLLINDEVSHPPREIYDAIWPDENTDSDAASSNLRGLIYRFRQIFSLISDYQLIESTCNGYRLNPELNIKTDMHNFDSICKAIHNTNCTPEKMELISQIIDIYKGEIYPPAKGENWLTITSNYFSLKYAGIINDTLNRLAELKEWNTLNYYATKSLAAFPENIKAYFWLIYSMYQSGTIETAKNEVKRAKTILTDEEYISLINQMKKARIDKLNLI